LIFEFKLPDIGEGLSEGELLGWHVGPGDLVEEGQDVAEFSTDKVAVVLPSPRSGRVLALLASPGDIVPVGSVILRIELETSDVVNASQSSGGGHATVVPPASASLAATDSLQEGTQRAAAGAGVRAVPAARRYAQERGVDLAVIAAQIGDRMITRADIDDYLARADSARSAAVQGVRRERLIGARLGAAQRLAKSVHTLATSTLTIEVNGDVVLARCKDGAERFSPLAVIAHSVCAALRRHPRLNARIDEEAAELVMHSDVHLGIAVDTGAGLLVPVIARAGDLAIHELGALIGSLSEQTRSGALASSAAPGSTFTISSTGGLEQATFIGATPIVNLPNVATLWVSRIRDRPRVASDTLEIGPVFNCSLSFDHRHIHGAEAIRFLNDLAAELG